MSELKPCPVPWCEKENPPVIWHPDYAPVYTINCPDCGLETNDFVTKAEAIAAWNTRPQPSAEPVAVWREACKAEREAPYGTPHDDTANQAAASVIASALEAARREALPPLQLAISALTEAREALHFHYVEWDGEPEDAVPLQLARAKCDQAISVLKENTNG